MAAVYMQKICAILLIFSLIFPLCACSRISQADVGIFLTEWTKATGTKEDLLPLLSAEEQDGKTVYELPLEQIGDAKITLTFEANEQLDLMTVTLSATGVIGDSVRTSFEAYWTTVIDVFTRGTDDAAQVINDLKHEGYRTENNTVFPMITSTKSSGCRRLFAVCCYRRRPRKR